MTMIIAIHNMGLKTEAVVATAAAVVRYDIMSNENKNNDSDKIDNKTSIGKDNGRGKINKDVNSNGSSSGTPYEKILIESLAMRQDRTRRGTQTLLSRVALMRLERPGRITKYLRNMYIYI